MGNNDDQTANKLSINLISKHLQKVLDEMVIITEEIAEIKAREGGEHGDN